jgi:hypothetical protein
MIKFKNSNGDVIHIVESLAEKTISTALKFTVENKRWLQSYFDFQCQNQATALKIGNINQDTTKMSNEELQEVISLAKSTGLVLKDKLALQEDLLSILGLSDNVEDFTFADLDKIFNYCGNAELANQAPKALEVEAQVLIQ